MSNLLQLPPLKHTDVLISHCFRYEGNLSSASCSNRVLILATLCTATRLLQRHHSAGRSHKLGSRVAATSYVNHTGLLATAQPLTHTHTHTHLQVLDVTAGPCQHGVVGAGEGTVAPGSLPRVGSDISADPPPPDAAGKRSLYKGVCITSLTRQLCANTHTHSQAP